MTTLEVTGMVGAAYTNYNVRLQIRFLQLDKDLGKKALDNLLKRVRCLRTAAGSSFLAVKSVSENLRISSPI